MKQRTLGTGLTVSEIGFGCMSLTGAYGQSGGPAREDAIALIRRAADLGVTFFDTAGVYGPFTNEDIVGAALEPRCSRSRRCRASTRCREQDTIPVLAELGIGLVPYSPLGKGFLTGTINASTTFADSDFRGQTPRFQGEALAANLALVDVLTQLAAKAGATPAQLALTWLLNQQPWIVPIPGTKNPARLAENTAAASLELTTGQLAELQAAAEQIRIVGARYPEAQDAMTNNGGRSGHCAPSAR